MNSLSLRALTPIALALTLAACATHPHASAQPRIPVAPPAAAQADIKPEVEPPAKPFAKDTLYDLLLAEIAAQRNRLDITLTRYAKQAKETQDPNVLERATQISQFVNAQPMTMELAQMWSSADPQSIEAHYLLVLNTLRNERYDLAIPALDSLLKMDPDADLEQIFLNAIPPTKDGRDKLLKALDGLPKQYADNPHIYFARALVQDQNGDHDVALSNVRQAEKARPQSIPAILLEARILQEQKLDGEAEAKLAQALEAHPESRALRLNYARVLVHARKMKEAENEYIKLVAQRPDDGDVLLTLGLLALENHDDDLAGESLERLLALNVHEDEAHYYLGALARQRKDIDTARSEFESVEPGSVYLAAQSDLADLLVSANDIPGARQHLSAARSTAPDLAPQLYVMEADLLTKAKRPDEALDLLNSALKTAPQNELLLYSRAMAAEKLDHIDVFEADMRTLLDREPDNATALNALGYTLAERTNRLNEAQSYLNKAMTLRPNDPAIIDSVGWLKYRQGDAKGALDYLQKAYALLPDDEIAAHLGEVLWVLGRKTEARQVWTEALARVPDSEFIVKVRARLDPVTGLKKP